MSGQEIGDPRKHPTRARILETFTDRPSGVGLTPADLATEIGESLWNVVYHCRVLERHGELETADDDPRSGGQAYRIPA